MSAPVGPGLRARRRGMRPLRAGLLVAVVAVVGVYFGFTKHVPFTHGFRLKAVFASAVDIRQHSPVRIAGVAVGQVTGIARYPGSDAALVTMDLQKSALPLHSDATLKIRPRIFLEGNFFVDLSPGSPSAPSVSSGYTVPIAQTSDPVQLDQVLSALNSNTRDDLQQLLIGYGQALTHVPTAAENANQDKLVRGLTAAQAINASYHRGPAALRDSSIVLQSLLGTSDGDVSRLVASLGRVSAALNRHEAALQDLIVNFDATLGAFASQAAPLQQAVAELPGALTSAQRAFAALNGALHATRTFALELIPAVQETPAAISAALPWLAQADQLVAPAQLGGLAKDLGAAAPSLGALVPAQTAFNGQLDPVSRCLANVIFPAGNVKLNDGALSSGAENYKEFWYSMVGLAGEGANFDGNGSYVHFQVGGGGNTFDTGPAHILGSSAPGTKLSGRAPLPLLGTSPAYPGVEPPYVNGTPCYTQALPNFNGPQSHGPADGSAGSGK